ncbi:hypothetical protein PVA45_07215 (plasmid) [Entomospira entomophila]|uniref:Uncharacterized protein n=1 Tax=Entomospira entomophila TaxID=2719988 RepID=A0A968GA66_9SPIO|nr:hypothetical protein [Entomospira entomophilus]NIZ41352.1 hypothetical protein [Entomospira entomophilus]WDI36237.1 hypothetical protein PVA45_07215 [Entomospira entomophilus]
MAIRQFFLWMAKVIRREENHEVQASSFAEDVYDSKILHLQGFASGVPDESLIMAVQLGHHRNKTYLLPFKLVDLQEMKSGEAKLYATNEDGSQVVGSLELTNDGKLAIATENDDLLAIIKETLALLQELQTFGSPTTQLPPPSWIEKASKLEERLDSITK